MNKNCVLCEGLKDEFKNIKSFYPKLQNSVTLFETKNFKIIPDKFPLTDNHIIIISKNHINTFAEFNNIEAEEIGYILDKLENITKAKSFIMFEHGTSKNTESNTPAHIKSIFHAHLHFIPNIKCTTEDMKEFFKNKDVNLLDSNNKQLDIFNFETTYKGNYNLINFIRNNVIYEDKEKKSVESYFYIKNSNNTQLFFPERIVTPQIPSQFLREALSKQCNTPEWNWKLPLTENGHITYEKRMIKMNNLFKSSNSNIISQILTKLKER